jgi:hypothetical protein
VVLLSVGYLALGAPDHVHRFGNGDGTTFSTNILTGFILAHDMIHSSSWGLHIGSVAQCVKASLILGGLDQLRALGTVSTYDNSGIDGRTRVPLINLTLGLESGGSPQNNTEIGSLHHVGGNASIQPSLNPMIPYMHLPPGLCEAVAELLPGTFQKVSGFYTWNVS